MRHKTDKVCLVTNAVIISFEVIIYVKKLPFCKSLFFDINNIKLKGHVANKDNRTSLQKS